MVLTKSAFKYLRLQAIISSAVVRVLVLAYMPYQGSI